MKTNLWIKAALYLPMILLVDYIFMIILGAIAGFFGFSDNYFCTSFCHTGKIILVISAIFFLITIYPDIKGLLKSKQDGKTQTTS